MTFILASSFGKLHGEIFTRIELDDIDMHPKQCTQNLFWFNGEATSGDFLCLQHASLTAWDSSRASDPPHFPLHNFFFIRDLHRTCQGFIPVETKRSEEPQTVRPGPVREWDGMQKG
jgi:hypothetical protein